MRPRRPATRSVSVGCNSLVELVGKSHVEADGVNCVLFRFRAMLRGLLLTIPRSVRRLGLGSGENECAPIKRGRYRPIFCPVESSAPKRPRATWKNQRAKSTEGKDIVKLLHKITLYLLIIDGLIWSGGAFLLPVFFDLNDLPAWILTFNHLIPAFSAIVLILFALLSLSAYRRKGKPDRYEHVGQSES